MAVVPVPNRDWIRALAAADPNDAVRFHTISHLNGRWLT